jgi:hypothetical protein
VITGIPGSSSDVDVNKGSVFTFRELLQLDQCLF